MRPPSLVIRALLTAIVLASVGCAGIAGAQSSTVVSPVVFVCEHGNVKSLIASSLFDRAATERGLPFRSVSRGVSPDLTVSQKISDTLRGEGFDVSNYRPEQLSKQDVSKASLVVAIGVDFSRFSTQPNKPVVSWGDIPPVSVDYPASKAALLKHINELLDELAAVPRR